MFVKFRVIVSSIADKLINSHLKLLLLLKLPLTTFWPYLKQATSYHIRVHPQISEYQFYTCDCKD